QYSHAEVFPIFRVGYLLDKVFGDRLEENIFNEGELADLVVPSTYFVNWSPINMGFNNYLNVIMGMMFNNGYPFFPLLPDGTPIGIPYIDLNTFSSAVLVSDFLKQVLKLFCATLVTVNGRFRIIRNTDILSADPTGKWESKLINKLAISIA